MRALFWFFPIILWGAWLLAEELGSGGFYGLQEGGGASFTGDTAGLVFTASDDNIIDIAGTDSVCWESGTCLECSGTDGTCAISTNALLASSGRLCLGVDGNGASTCFENNNSAARFLDGLGNVDQIYAGGVFLRDTIGGNNLLELFSDSLHLEEGHANGGYISWNATTGQAGTSGVVLSGINSATNEMYIYANSAASSLGVTTHSATFRMGDMKSGTGNLPTCDISTAGVINFANNSSTNENEHYIGCVEEYDGSSMAYRWAAFGSGMKSHWYVDDPDDGSHPNNNSTTITGSGTWDVLKATTGQMWNAGLQAGFQLQADGTFNVVGEWQTDGSARWFKVTYTLSFSGSASTEYAFTVRVNDNEGSPATTEKPCYVMRSLTGTSIGSVSAVCAFSMDVDGTNNDSWWVAVQQVAGSTTDITIEEGSIFMEAM